MKRTAVGDPPTGKQAAILGFVVAFTRDHLYQPSYREIMAEFGIKSKNVLFGHFRSLARKGHLRVGRQRSRALDLAARPRWSIVGPACPDDGDTTPSQREVFSFLVESFVRDFHQPTVREIGAHFGWSATGAICHLAALQHKGYLSLAGGRSRAIEILRKPTLTIAEGEDA